MKAFPLSTPLAVALIPLPLAFRDITSGVGDIRISLTPPRSALTYRTARLRAPSSPAVLNKEGGPLCVCINGHRLVLVRESL
jgi:hypothetical protein